MDWQFGMVLKVWVQLDFYYLAAARPHAFLQKLVTCLIEYSIHRG